MRPSTPQIITALAPNSDGRERRARVEVPPGAVAPFAVRHADVARVVRAQRLDGEALGSGAVDAYSDQATAA